MQREISMQGENKIGSAFWALRIGLGATAFLAGADKFTNLLTDWGKYMAPEAGKTIPLSRKNFMHAAGGDRNAGGRRNSEHTHASLQLCRYGVAAGHSGRSVAER